MTDRPDVDAARNAVESQPNDSAYQIRLARTLMDAAWHELGSRWTSNYEEASTLLRAVVDSEPDNAIALVNLGVALSDLGSHRHALDCYRRAETLGWIDGNLHFNIGVALVNLADNESYGRYFQTASIHSDHPDTMRAYFDPQAH